MSLNDPLMQLHRGDEYALKPSLLTTVFHLFWVVGPTVLSFCFQMGVELINVFFIGNIDKVRLDGVGLGNMWGNITGIAIGWGLAGGLDTLCSQANGSKRFEMVGIWLQRGLFVLTMFFIPIMIGWLYTEEVLQAFGVSEIISEYSQNYLTRVLPGLWFFLAFDFYRRFMQSQGYFWPGLTVNMITTCLHVFWDWFLIINLDLKEKGAGIATAITYISNFILMLGIIRFFQLDRKTCLSCKWDNFFPQIWTFLKYAVPSAGMIVLDYMNFEVTQIEANMLGETTQAAHISVMNTVSLLYMIPLGISIGITVLIGNSIGEGDRVQAKSYASAACLGLLFTVLPIDILLLFFRDYISTLYSYDEVVIETVKEILPLMVVFNIIDSYQCVLGGILKGIAMQKVAVLAILISYYVFALPIGYVLAFHMGAGIFGLWYGLIIGAIMSDITLGFVLLRAKWEAKTLQEFN